MKWRPITESELRKLIDDSWTRMSAPQQRLWKSIRITPAKWKQEPWGHEGDGFWAVAILGTTVVWYNDIEEGFNRSDYETYGTIHDYWCDQDNLEWTLQHFLDELQPHADG